MGFCHLSAQVEIKGFWVLYLPHTLAATLVFISSNSTLKHSIGFNPNQFSFNLILSR